MSKILTRRAVVTAAPAAIVAASLPAIAGAGLPNLGDARLDAALLALRQPYERTLAGIAAASPAHSAAEDAYQAARRAQPHLDEAVIRKACGLARAERVWTRAVEANTAVIDRIAEVPAHTLEGLILKARVAETDSYNLDLAASIVADLVAMEERNA